MLRCAQANLSFPRSSDNPRRRLHPPDWRPLRIRGARLHEQPNRRVWRRNRALDREPRTLPCQRLARLLNVYLRDGSVPVKNADTPDYDDGHKRSCDRRIDSPPVRQPERDDERKNARDPEDRDVRVGNGKIRHTSMDDWNEGII